MKRYFVNVLLSSLSRKHSIVSRSSLMKAILMISWHSSLLALTPTWTRVVAHLKARPLMLKFITGIFSPWLTRDPSMISTSSVCERNFWSSSFLLDLMIASTALGIGSPLHLIRFLDRQDIYKFILDHWHCYYYWLQKFTQNVCSAL